MPSSPDSGSSKLFTWVLQVVGAGAALVGWVAVVGAAREWATFRAAGIPSPVPTAALLPRASLVGDGLTALAPILGVGLVMAGLAYVIVRTGLQGAVSYRRRKSLRQRVYRSRGYALAAVLISVLLLFGLNVWFQFHPSRAIAWFLVVTLVGLVVMLALTSFELWSTHPGRAALAAFSAVAVIGGAWEFWWVASNPSPKFDSVLVLRRGGRSSLSGFFLTRTGSDVYIAVHPSADRRINPVIQKQFDVMTIPGDEVELVILGPAYKLSGGQIAPHQPTHPPLTPAPVPTPKQVTVPIPTPPPTGPAPVIGVEALDELKSTGQPFTFRVSSPSQWENYDLVAVASLPGGPVVLTTSPKSPFRVTPNHPVAVQVIPTTALNQALRIAPVHVSLAVRATANSQTASARYTVCLQLGSGEDERLGVHLPPGCP